MGLQSRASDSYTKTMKLRGACPKCAGTAITRVDEVAELGVVSGDEGVTDQYRPWLLARQSDSKAVGQVAAYVCRACGYTEFFSCGLPSMPYAADSGLHDHQVELTGTVRSRSATKSPKGRAITFTNPAVGAVTIAEPVIKIGTLGSNHLCLRDAATVARMHAVIEVTTTQVLLIDLGSEGGTTVNSRDVNKKLLKSGDTLRFGQSAVYVISFD